ncbi:MAG: chromosome segregation protein SMC, partial [Candidatus Omnitrophica bacterium]|nr:chromosome segregation protein SMC [Candidatus Omnitrophota bacterium]
MRFKKLELVGFKSFAQKTAVHFEPGVTAIVGPNGSGKSNLVDAIRWVLGEHNPRDVRAPRLEDVIFNGTDETSPLSMAEVNLTIDNAQGLLPISFSEVTITRRVYRSGESECLINQSPCRLRDVQELFLGTGLGGGTYAIIEQGHIDLILSSKPEERRVVFEEASGVAKYLAKKQETVRRLDETEEHLVRIADIIGEVRRQVGALERAANKARQYKTQWEQLKALELRLAVDELCAGEGRHKELEARVQALAAQRDELETQKTTHMTALEAANSAVSAIQQRLQALRTTIVECDSQIAQHESQRTLKARWIEELGTQTQGLEQEEGQLRARLGQLEEQRSRLGGAESEIRAQLAAVQQQLSQGCEELSSLTAASETAQRTVADAKAQLFEAAAEASHQRNQLAELASRLQGVEAQLARLDAGGAQRAAQGEDARRRHATVQQERDTLQQQHEELQGRLATTQRSLDAAGARRHELTGRLHQMRDQVASERAQVALWEDLWRRYEGFPETVKTLMTQSIDGLIGPLVDLVQAQPGYEDIVEAALGPLADALVVRDRAALSRCREALAAQQLSGCRFLVLSDCPVALSMEQVNVGEGVTGAVKEFVRAEPQYQPLVDWLLNDSWVIDDIQRLLAGRTAPAGRLVSVRGDRWDRRSWRFGGTRASAHGRLGRRQRWEEGRTALQARELEFLRLEAEAAEAEQTWQACLTEQESAKSRLAQTAPALHKLETQLGQLSRELARCDEERATGELEMQELAAQQEELQSSLAAARQAVEDAECSQQTLERSLADAQASRETSEQRRQELLIARAQVEASLQSLTERLGALQVRVGEVEADRAQLVQQLEAKGRQRNDAQARAAELTQQVEAHREGDRQLQEERTRVDSEAAAVGQALREEELRRDQLLPHLLAAEQQLSALMREIQEQAQQLSERTFRRSHLMERLRELYQIDEATVQVEQQAAPAPLTEESAAAAAAEIQKLRAKLEGIGPVSLGSVEEYDELTRRLEFLQTQQQDLIRARDDLKASITQINRTARAQFRETFQRITQEFQHYFT